MGKQPLLFKTHWRFLFCTSSYFYFCGDSMLALLQFQYPSLFREFIVLYFCGDSISALLQFQYPSLFRVLRTFWAVRHSSFHLWKLAVQIRFKVMWIQHYHRSCILHSCKVPTSGNLLFKFVLKWCEFNTMVCSDLFKVLWINTIGKQQSCICFACSDLFKVLWIQHYRLFRFI